MLCSYLEHSTNHVNLASMEEPDISIVMPMIKAVLVI